MAVRGLVALLLVATGAATAFAQGALYASLSGRVDDPSAAVVPGAAVVLTSMDTGLAQTSITGESGRYQFARVPPGRYLIEARSSGFGRVQQSVTLSVNDVLVLDLVLPLATVDASVTVAASQPASRSTAQSTVIEAGQIEDLPLNSRGFQRLMLLAPGMATASARGSLSNPSVSGTRSSSNNFVIDGMTANEERVGSIGLAPGNSSGLTVPDVISTEALQQFRVITSNADATFGRGAGAQINVVTKSGTNQLRGSIYEYFRDEALDARDYFNRGPYFDTRGNPVPPPLQYHLFGATLGGPIVKNRHFLFGSYEGFRQREDLVSNLTLPNADLIGLIPGDLGRLFRVSFLDSNFIPSNGNPAGEFRAFSAADRAAAAAAGFPARLFDGDQANGEAGVVISSVPQPREYNQNALLLRSDHRLTDRLSLSARYARTGNVFERYSGRPGTLFNTSRDFDSGVVQAVAVLSPGHTLEARGGWLWNTAPLCTLDLPDVPTAGRGFTLNLTGTTAFTLPSVGTPCTFEDTQFVPQFGAQHTWTRGNVVLRSGVDIRDVRYDFANYGLGIPTYQFNGLVGATALLGSSPSQRQSVAATYSGSYFGGEAGLPDTPLRRYQSLQQEYFSQADWQALPQLTVNVGLRYTIFGTYQVDGASNLFAVNAAGTVVPDVSPFEFGRTANRPEVLGGDRPAYRQDRNNIQPRLGVAWDPTGRGQTVVRGAYGMYHDRLYQFAFANLVVNRPFALSGSASAVPFELGQLPALNPATPGVFAIDPGITSPYFHRTSIGVDQQVGFNTVLSVAYVGTFGRNLARIVDYNFGPGFPQAARPDPRFAEVVMLTNATTSRYDALQVQLRASPAAGISATAAYTYSRLNDFWHPDGIGAGQQIPTALVNTGASADAGFQVGAFTPQREAAYAGRSDQDLPHVLAVSHLVEIPFGRGRRWGTTASALTEAVLGGWSIAGILQARSGAPVNVTLGRDVNDDGYIIDRPALLSGDLGDLYGSGGDKAQYLVSQAEALRRLGVPANVSDASAQIPYNALQAPAVWTYDASLQKQLPLGGRVRLAVELNAFNVFNRTNLAAPNANLSSALFGTITSTAPGFGPRQLQLSGKLFF